jgi:hypothetical protein
MTQENEEVNLGDGTYLGEIDLLRTRDEEGDINVQ